VLGSGVAKEATPVTSFELRLLAFRYAKMLMKPVTRMVPQPRPLLLAGPGSSSRLCHTIAEFGFKRVTIITDAVLVRLGVVAPIRDALEKCGVVVAIFDGIEPDPTYRVIENGHKAVQAHGSDSVLAVGGGSSIDAAKVIAAMATTNKPPKKLLGFFKLSKPMLPLFVIPTTAGTGSEVTIAAVISDPDTHSKAAVIDPRLVPTAAALDPVLMTGMPKPITAATGMDALTHAVEAYTNRWPNAETGFYSRSAVRMIFANLPRAYANGDDLDAREAMAIASCYAGLAFTKAYVGYVHAFSHALGGRYGTPHGLGNAITMPYVLDYVKEAPWAQERLAELAIAIGAGQPSEPKTLLASRFIERVRELSREVGIPERLDALKAADIPAIAKAAMIEAHRDYPVPRDMTFDDAQALLGRMLVQAAR
jgi:alcohol dehydrogenase